MSAAPINVGWTLLAIVPACLLGASSVFAQSSTGDNRIVISGDIASLTGTNGGGGGSLAWLHTFDPGTLFGLAIEHQVLADSRWTFGSVNGSYAFGPDRQRFGIYGEAHVGRGNDGTNPFDYEIEALGFTGTFNHKMTALLEDRRIDVDTSHGNLPKAGLTYLWGPHLLTSVSYQHSVSGNLGTRITSVRIDGYQGTLDLFAGVAFGQGSPAVVNIASQILAPAGQLHEGYLGMSKFIASWHGDLTAVVDYLDLAGVKRATLTVAYIYHVGR
jgi:hypothetical protein